MQPGGFIVPSSKDKTDRDENARVTQRASTVYFPRTRGIREV